MSLNSLVCTLQDFLLVYPEYENKNLYYLQTELILLIAEVTGLKVEKIHLEDRLVEDLGLDSFTAMELLVSLEQKYRIRFSEADLAANRTLKDWIKLIGSRSKRDSSAGVTK